jgi:uncharacterized sulfatase
LHGALSLDQTYSDFGFMGHPHVRTPHIDRLAAKSARYPNGYVPSSVCRPSLVTLLTGLYPHQHGVHFNHPPPGFAKLTQSPEIDKKQYDALRNRATFLIRSVPTLPRILASEGYRSFQTGKYWEGHWRNAGFTEGKTTAEPSNKPDALGNKQLANGDLVAHGNGDHGLVIGRNTMHPIFEFVDDCHKENTPFLLWYAPFLPHLPHNSPQRSCLRRQSLRDRLTTEETTGSVVDPREESPTLKGKMRITGPGKQNEICDHSDNSAGPTALVGFRLAPIGGQRESAEHRAGDGG